MLDVAIAWDCMGFLVLAEEGKLGEGRDSYVWTSCLGVVSFHSIVYGT